MKLFLLVKTDISPSKEWEARKGLLLIKIMHKKNDPHNGPFDVHMYGGEGGIRTHARFDPPN